MTMLNNRIYRLTLALAVTSFADNRHSLARTLTHARVHTNIHMHAHAGRTRTYTRTCSLARMYARTNV